MMSCGCTGYCYCNTVLYGVAMGCSDSAREVLQDFTDQNLHMCRRLLNRTVGTKSPSLLQFSTQSEYPAEHTRTSVRIGD